MSRDERAQARDDDEWLETDGLGGFAMGTRSGVRTRRYHGVLVPARRPPAEREVLVAGLEVWVDTAEGTFALSSQRYQGGVVHPDGRERVVSFAHTPWPHWTFVLPGGLRVTHELFLVHGDGAAVLRWRIEGGAARLRVRPLLAGRDFHHLAREDGGWPSGVALSAGRVLWPMRTGAVVAAWTDGRYQHEPTVYRGFFYEEEAARGLDAIEDLHSPGVLAWSLEDGAAADLVLSTREPGAAGTAAGGAAVLRAREEARRGGFATPLHRAADAYLVRRGAGMTVIAGYPWFGDWGRDTFIALRGLCLAGGRVADALAILGAWADAVSDGMLPNRFPDRGDTPEYNSVDASLWYVVAAGETLARAPGAAQAGAIRDAMAAILRGYAKGTRYRIGVDPDDGLLRAGVPGVQLTWMDARVGEREITPRIGKPVEIQALWLNALAVGGALVPELASLLPRGLHSFRRRFVADGRDHLADVVDVDHVPGTFDDSLRPNQVLALGGLPLTLVPADVAARALGAVERALVTPLGLRTLAPDHPSYRGHYRGGVADRDGAYHQGTVWPWLLGPFVEAWLAARGGTPAARAEAKDRFVAPLEAHLDTDGLGHVTEVADGDPPHTPGGCPFQAWSVGALLRLRSLCDQKEVTS